MTTDLSANIKAAIERGGFSQVGLAEATGVSESTISLWISGKRTPGMKNLQKLAKAMGLEAQDLWAGPEAMPANAAQKSVLEDMNQLDATQQETIAALVRSMRPNK